MQSQKGVEPVLMISEKDDILQKCEMHANNSNVNESSNFFGGIIFQGLLVYCIYIYYYRILDAGRMIWNNIEITFTIFIHVLKCLVYIIILILSLHTIIGATSNDEEEIDVLKLMGLVSFLDFLDRRIDIDRR
tara:strand:+ start:4614 stop:5012 length:399 start_codon:yes stop_codon:yes gene_type:complete